MYLYSQTLSSLLPLVFDQSLLSCHLMSSTALLKPHILHPSSSSSYSPPSSTFPSCSFLISLFYLISHHLSPLLPSTQLSFLFLLSSTPPPSFDLTLLFCTATPPPFSPLPPLLFFVISPTPLSFPLLSYRFLPSPCRLPHFTFLTHLFLLLHSHYFPPITSPCLTFSPHSSSSLLPSPLVPLSPLVHHYCHPTPILLPPLYTILAVQLNSPLAPLLPPSSLSFSSLPGYHSPNCSAATVPSPIITACQKELIFSFLIKTCKKLPCYYNAATLWRHQRKPNLISEILPSHIKLNT